MKIINETENGGQFVINTNSNMDWYPSWRLYAQTTDELERQHRQVIPLYICDNDCNKIRNKLRNGRRGYSSNADNENLYPRGKWFPLANNHFILIASNKKYTLMPYSYSSIVCHKRVKNSYCNYVIRMVWHRHFMNGDIRGFTDWLYGRKHKIRRVSDLSKKNPYATMQVVKEILQKGIRRRLFGKGSSFPEMMRN